MPACDYSECHKVLKSPVMNQIVTNTKHDFSRNFLQWFKSLTYEVYSQLKSSGMDFGITFPYKGVPVSFDFGQDMSKDKFEETKKMIDEGQFEQVELSTAEEYASRFETGNVAKDWSDCMKNMMETCMAVTPGQVIYEVERIGDDIALEIKYLKASEEPWPKVVSFDIPSNIVCESGCLKEGDEINRQRLITFKVNSIGSGYIAIQTDRGEPFRYLVRPTISNKQLEKAHLALRDYCKTQFREQFPNTSLLDCLPRIEIEDESIVDVSLLMLVNRPTGGFPIPPRLPFRFHHTNTGTFKLSQVNTDNDSKICTKKTIRQTDRKFCVSVNEIQKVIEDVINEV